MRSRRPLTSRGLAAVLIGLGCAVAANLFAAPILLYVAVLLIALVVVAAVVVHAPRRSGTVTRRISTDLLTVDERSDVSVRFELRAMRVPSGTWEDHLPEAVTGRAAGIFPTDDGTHLQYSIVGARRGIWPIGPLSLHTLDPFGLAQRLQEFGDSRTVVVVPEVVTLAPMTSVAGIAGGTAHTASSRLGQGSDNLSPRLYVPGDSMRRIHWRATAHRGDLMVRQEEAESSPDAVVVLDRTARRWARRSAAPDADFEHAVSACASIALHLAHEGYTVDVCDSAGMALGTLRGQEDERDALLVALATVSPQGEGGALPALFDGAPPGPLVMVTGEFDETDAAALRHGGAAAPVLLMTGAAPGAIEAAAALGWSAGALSDDIAGAWEDALSENVAPGGGHVPR